MERLELLKKLSDLRLKWQEEGKRHCNAMEEFMCRKIALQRECKHVHTKTKYLLGPNNTPYKVIICEECDLERNEGSFPERTT